LAELDDLVKMELSMAPALSASALTEPLDPSPDDSPCIDGEGGVCQIIKLS
jgi:hypothetical protein